MRWRLAASFESFSGGGKCKGHGRSGAQAIRRRVRLYYWKQWKNPRTRRRRLLALGADPKTVHMATRSRKGYWRMSQNEIVRFALNNRWLKKQGVPDVKAIWITVARASRAPSGCPGQAVSLRSAHYGPKARV